jgi:hypothetical protein
MVSIGEDSMISLGDNGENQGSNLMGNKYSICTFSLITIPKMLPVSQPMMINVKQCMVREIFFLFQWWCHKKSLGTTALEEKVIHK